MRFRVQDEFDPVIRTSYNPISTLLEHVDTFNCFKVQLDLE